jgi:hypothetical protein
MHRGPEGDGAPGGEERAGPFAPGATSVTGPGQARRTSREATSDGVPAQSANSEGPRSRSVARGIAGAPSGPGPISDRSRSTAATFRAPAAIP